MSRRHGRWLIGCSIIAVDLLCGQVFYPMSLPVDLIIVFSVFRSRENPLLFLYILKLSDFMHNIPRDRS